MSQHGSTPTDGTEQMTPEEVRDSYMSFVEALDDHGDDPETLVDTFTVLFTPRKRGRLLHAILGLHDPEQDMQVARTASEICERYGISRSAFGDHIDILVAADVVEKRGKRGNAMTYAPNRAHPVVQLLTMTKTVQRHGQTPDLLDDQFIGQPGAGVDPETGEER